MTQKTIDFATYKKMKGTKQLRVLKLSPGGIIQTKYGPRLKVVFENKENIPLSLLMKEESTDLHPNSMIYKLLNRYNAENLGQMEGKLIEARIDSNGFWRIVI